MPTYLCHAFRWHRPSINIFIIRNDLEDASTEWIIPPPSAGSILEAFYDLYDFLPDGPVAPSAAALRHAHQQQQQHHRRPSSQTRSQSGTRSRSQSLSHSRPPPAHATRSRSRSTGRFPTELARGRGGGGGAGSLYYGTEEEDVDEEGGGDGGTNYGEGTDTDAVMRAQDWSTVKLLEEYDPRDLTTMSRPYAYVADYVVRVDLSVGVAAEMQRYEARAGAGAGAGWFEKLREQLQADEEIRWYVVVNGDEVRGWPGEGEVESRPASRTRASSTASGRRWQQQQQQQQQQQYQHQTRLSDAGDDRILAEPSSTEQRPDVPEKDPPASGLQAPVGKGKSSKGSLRRLFGVGRSKHGG